VKNYYWIKVGTWLFTWSKALDQRENMTAVDLSDPALPDEIVDVNPDADAFAGGTTDQ
jgi:hypothetical protein